MKLIIKTTTAKTKDPNFGGLKNGEIFVYSGRFYMKINGDYSLKGLILENGQLADFNDSTLVVPVKKAELNIEV